MLGNDLAELIPGRQARISLILDQFITPSSVAKIGAALTPPVDSAQIEKLLRRLDYYCNPPLHVPGGGGLL